MLNKLTFESEGLTVDYLSFNITGLTNPESIAKIASYLSESFGFNSQIKEKHDKHFQDLVLEENNAFQVRFLRSLRNTAFKTYWDGTTISFSGTNAAQIYKHIQRRHFDWTVFKDYKINLGRFDLSYFRKDKTTDPNDNNDNYLELEKFMEKSCQRVQARSKRRYASWHRNSKGLILKIGSRTSSNYYRVYKKKGQSGLKFELEIKHKVVQSFQPYLFGNDIQIFEHKLSRYFYFQSFESFNLNTYSMDWLLDWYRRASTKHHTNSLLTTYLTKPLKDQLLVFNLFRFLSFLQHKEIKNVRIPLGNQVYCLIHFPVTDFTRYLGIDHKSHYQRKKVLQILKDLQVFKLQEFIPALDNFTDFEFRSSVMIPHFEVKKKDKVWLATVAVAEQLLRYNYPFQFNEYFLNWDNPRQFQVKSQILQVISQNSLKKTFHLQEFLKPFQHIANGKKTLIKDHIITAITQQVNHGNIQSRIKLIKTDQSIQYFHVHQLASPHLSQVTNIQLYENILYKTLFEQK